MSEKWVVTSIKLTDLAQRFGKRAHYKYHVEGINEMDGGKSFSWTVPDVSNPDYDLSRVIVPDLPEVPRG